MNVPANRQQNNRRPNTQNQPRAEERFDIERERQLYYAWLSDPKNEVEFRAALGPKVDLKRWLQSARDAVEVNPKLLAPSLRQSLLFGIKKAAQQRLRPDGRQGALIPRLNNDAKAKLVCWQPMVQGVIQLGRRAGVLKALTAEIVFVGEPFKFLRGDDPKIIHEWMPDIREQAYALLRNPPKAGSNDGPPDWDADNGGPLFDKFWDEVVAAYCIIEAPDGTKTRRAMTRSRLLLLRDFAKARGGPWFSVWLDEMIVKAAILHAVKHIDTNVDDEEGVKAFRSALEQDMDVDLEDDEDDDNPRAIIDQHVRPAPAALEAPNPTGAMTMDKLSRFAKQPEAVEVQQEPVRHQREAPPPAHEPPPNEGQRSDESPSVTVDPILANDDGLDVDDEEIVKAIAAGKQWARNLIDKDLPEMTSPSDIDALLGDPEYPNTGNAAVKNRIAWLKKHAPNTYVALMDSIAARRGELEAQSHAA